MTTFADDQIKNELLAGYPGAKSSNLDTLTAIAQDSDLGGLVTLAFYVLDTMKSRSLISTPGNTSVLLADLQQQIALHPEAKVILAGHSDGGGDVQNLLWDLNGLGFPVALSGHIDSVEILSGDASIPQNTSRAMGFYQDDGPWYSQGENNLYAVDPSKSVVTNKHIDKPAGPADPATDNNAYHRNMDNDERVWGDLLDYIQQNIQ